MLNKTHYFLMKNTTLQKQFQKLLTIGSNKVANNIANKIQT